MSTEAPLPTGTGQPAKKQPALRLWVLAIVLGLATLYGWLLWPSDMVKIVPRTKLADYQRAGLVKAGAR